MRREDIPQVSAIDRQAFPTQWPPPPFKRDLDSRTVRYLVALEETDKPHPSIEIIETRPQGKLPRLMSRIRALFSSGHYPDSDRDVGSEDNIVGYAALWLILDEAHLTSIAVRESYRRRGIGELLLVSVMDMAMRLKAQVVTLETRVSNLPAQALYEKYGFAKTGTRRRYYSDNGEDAVIMTAENIASASYQARFQELRRSCLERCGAAP
jgi:ribosomal-protein-alanine N-acetyltransferase